MHEANTDAAACTCAHFVHLLSKIAHTLIPYVAMSSRCTKPRGPDTPKFLLYLWCCAPSGRVPHPMDRRKCHGPIPDRWPNKSPPHPRVQIRLQHLSHPQAAGFSLAQRGFGPCITTMRPIGFMMKSTLSVPLRIITAVNHVLGTP